MIIRACSVLEHGGNKRLTKNVSGKKNRKHRQHKPTFGGTDKLTVTGKLIT